MLAARHALASSFVAPSLAALGLLAASARAADLVVGLPGSGAPFSSIQAAIDAAQPGDRVLVGAGEYQQSVLVNKAIELIGGLGGPTVILGTNPAPSQAPTQIVVRDLPAGSRARVSSFRVQPLNHSLYLPPPFAFGVYDCAGRVELSQLDLATQSKFGYPLGATIAELDIRNCAQVYASELSTPSQPSFASSLFSQGHHGANVEFSAVSFHRCQLRGELRTQGGAGLRAEHSAIELAGCVLVGGQAYGASGAAGQGGAGALLVASQLRVAGGSGSVLRGADAIDELIPFVAAKGLAAHAVDGDAASAVVLGAEVAPQGGSAAAGFPAAAAVSPALGSVNLLARRLPVLSFEPALGALGSPLAIRMEGEPGAIQWRFLSLATGPALSVPGVGGLVLLDLGAYAALGAKVLDGSGTAWVNSALPADPSFAGVQLLEQALQFASGELELSVPAALLVQL